HPHMHKLFCVAALTGAALLAGCHAGTVLKDRFPHSPTPGGWVYRTTNADSDGAWIPDDGGSLTATTGYWESPEFPIQGDQWYGLRVHTRVTNVAHMAVLFLNAQNVQIRADFYTRLVAIPGDTPEGTPE